MLDQQRHDARLQQLIPSRVHMLQRGVDVRLGDFVVLLPCRLPRSRNDLRLAEHGPQQIDDRRFDVARRHASDGARPGAML